VASKYKDEIDRLWNQVDEKIKLIKDPEPDSYKIKNDLMNKHIGGWTFVSLNEFKTFKIESTIKNPDKLSFLCKTDMLDLDDQIEYYAIFYVNYKLVNGEWRYSSLTEIFYDYKNSKNINNDKLILEGNWQWPQNSAEYNSDGTWSGKWKDGKEKNGRFKIINNKLTVYDETGSVFASGELNVINENELKLSNWSGTYTAKRLSN